MKMARKHWLAAAGLVVAAAFVLGESFAQPARMAVPPTPAKVAVCDLVNVFKNYKKVEKLNTQLQEKERELKAEEDRRVKMVSDLSEEIKALAEGSPEYEKRAEEILRRRFELDGWKKTNETLLLKWHYNATRQMFEEIQAVVKQVATERGYDLVLFREADNYQAANTNELLEEVVARRKVLYSNPSLDITQDVLALVNQRYATSQP